MGDELRFRRATEADLPTLVAMLADDIEGKKREIVSDPPDPVYVAAFRAIEASGSVMIVVAELEGKIIGSMQLVTLPGLGGRGAWRMQIEGVRVASHLRGQGYGTQMLRHAIAIAKERGCKRVQLTTHNVRGDAKRLYERLGFVASHVGMKLEVK